MFAQIILRENAMENLVNCSTFFKFPSTPHLAVSGNKDIRNDKVMSIAERDIFLKHTLTVEEKIDGTNIGISFDEEGNIQVQNRGNFVTLPARGQWKLLSNWLSERMDILFHYLEDKYILFGEWCYAKHSIFYTSLPDWFLGFDIFDKTSCRFFSSSKRDIYIHNMKLFQPIKIAYGVFTFHELKKMLQKQSSYASDSIEGIYLRYDRDEYLEQRAKLVRYNFIQSIQQHWKKSAITKNLLRYN